MTKNIVGFLAFLGFLVSPALASAMVAPPLTFTVDKTSIVASPKPVYADLPTLSWSSANMTSCTASGSGWSGPIKLSGNQKINPPITTIYTLTCVGGGGSTTKSVTVTVTPAQIAGGLSGFEQATQTGQTRTSFSYTWNNNLQIGSQTPDVSALQTALTLEDVYTGEITGGFYKQTFASVKAFQSKYSLDATGFVGVQTRAKLNALYSK